MVGDDRDLHPPSFSSAEQLPADGTPHRCQPDPFWIPRSLSRMLFRPEAFESLTEEAWDEERARSGIRAIVADAEEWFDPVALWPAEEWDSWGSPTPLAGLYCGAAGVVWALDALRRRGHADVGIALAAAAQGALERAREAPELSKAEDFELPRASDAGLFSGETGNLVVAWRVDRDASLEQTIEERIVESRESDANEVMWGAPGRVARRAGAAGVDRRRAL